MAPSRGQSGIVIFSGGSAANSLVDVFESIRKSRACSLSYIIPISDNGGSTSELIRVFGGPGIGDVRSRLVRLIPRTSQSPEREAIARLLSHRLSSSDGRQARGEWGEIVDGTSLLWHGISSAKKELLRSFFNVINLEILKRSRPPTSTFDFRSASIGNLFLTGARLFSGSFESAIYLLSAICGIPDDEVKVIPSINSNFSHHITAELEDGSLIVGQNSISHPSAVVGIKMSQVEAGNDGQRFVPTPTNEYTDSKTNGTDSVRPRSKSFVDYHEEEYTQEEEDAHPPFTLPTLRSSHITFTKDANELENLPSRIDRIYYVNSFGQEILPPANPRAVQAIHYASSIIYSIGSLYTSIVPNLVLRGIGDAMRRSHATAKILILNGCLDREVGPIVNGKHFSASDFIDALVKAGEQSRGVVWPPSTVVIRNSDNLEPETDRPLLSLLQSRPGFHRAKSDGHTLTLNQRNGRSALLPPPPLSSAAPSRAQSPSTSPDRSMPPTPTNLNSSRSSPKPDSIYRHYVTHLIHLPNTEGTPFVDSDLLLAQYGVKCVRVYGRRNEDGPGMLYDPQALKGAIEAILGGRVDTDEIDHEKNALKRGRRKTVER